MRAVRLKASDEILFYPDDSCDDAVLVDLLTEAYERNLRNRLILATVKERDWRYSEWGMDHTYKYPQRRFSYKILEETWKDLPGISGNEIFTPENENIRSNWIIESTAKKARMPVYIGLAMKLGQEYYDKLRKAAADPFHRLNETTA